MKMAVGFIALSLALIGVGSEALAQGKSLQVVSGACRLESTNETIKLVSIDPNMHYGVFAKGLSSKSDTISLMDRMDSIDIMIQGRGSMAYSTVARSAPGTTLIKTGILVLG